MDLALRSTSVYKRLVLLEEKTRKQWGVPCNNLRYSGDPSAGADEIDLEQVLDEDEDEQAANNVELEGGWEPERPQPEPEPGSEVDGSIDLDSEPSGPLARENATWGLSEANCHQVSLRACWTAYP
ncbi:hypothetical protein PAXINDRAFT_156243 [Paxillus involutus ATCC 200175]|uniref:Uncharacterized protein n=1 Tax=Paxillus involutus ATCC 200175 TaxID=664439 RepID=A0A0C9TV38_PAXIN|nr:hypothetical protein PAXINDRAFT_156243 [Paxillus involutus ATCC 200175]